MGAIELFLSVVLVGLLLMTKTRSPEMPRTVSNLQTQEGLVHLDLEKLASSRGMSVLAAYQQNKQKEPLISVRIKPRAKDHPSDDFKILVKYEIEMSKDE